MTSLREVFNGRMSRFDSDMCWNEEQDCVINALNNTGEIISVAFGERQAAVSMAALRATLSHQPCDIADLREGRGLELEWRKANFATESLPTWPMFFEELRALLGFAEYGIFAYWDYAGDGERPEGRERLLRLGDDLPGWVRDVTKRVYRIFSLAPEPDNIPYAPYDKLYRATHKALARLKYDEGGLLSPDELADLSGVSLKRVQNASYLGGEGAPIFDKKTGMVTPESARAWLVRKDFRFSIWRQIAKLVPLSRDWGLDVTADPDAIVNDECEYAPEKEEKYLFVPTAADGTSFLPYLRGPQGYKIGAKGAEQVEPDYFRALEMLTKQSTPRWRRPNGNKNWGIVSCQRWERVRYSVLESRIDEISA